MLDYHPFWIIFSAALPYLLDTLLNYFLCWITLSDGLPSLLYYLLS